MTRDVALAFAVLHLVGDVALLVFLVVVLRRNRRLEMREVRRASRCREFSPEGRRCALEADHPALHIPSTGPGHAWG